MLVHFKQAFWPTTYKLCLLMLALVLMLDPLHMIIDWWF